MGQAGGGGVMNDEDEALVAERQTRLDALGPMPSWWRLFSRHRWKRERSRICAMSVSMMTALMRRVYPPEMIENALRPHPTLSMIRNVKHSDGGAFTYTVEFKDKP